MIPALVLALAQAAAPPAALPAQPFFDTDSVFSFTIRADWRAIGRDRDTSEQAPWHPATLTWTGPEGERTVPLRVRTRGAWRLNHCDMPPLRLRFTGDSVAGTPFENLRRPKLGVYCRDRDNYEQAVLAEYTTYRVQQLFMPPSFRVRLVKVTYQQASGSGRPVTRYGIMLEDPERFYERIGSEPLETRGIRQNQLNRSNAATLGVWQYFIGNTDWSVPARHNIELFRQDGSLVAMAYDFDWSGSVNAPYARPASQLRIASVRDRLYRGQCLTAEELNPVLDRFEALRDSLAPVYARTPDLEAGTVREALQWYGDFYREIANRPRFLRSIQANCFP